MSLPKIVSRQKWVEARKALLAKEKEMTRARDALNAERRRLPMVKIKKDDVFKWAHGKATLPDLFEGRRQLIVYHMMWVDCPGCSLLVDNIGHLAHLHARDTTLVVVSRAPWPELKAFKARMGWTVPFPVTGATARLQRGSNDEERRLKVSGGTSRGGSKPSSRRRQVPRWDSRAGQMA